MKHTIETYRPILIRVVTMAAVMALAITLLSGCSRKTGAGIIVAGSTSVQPYAEVLAEEYMILHPGTEVDIQGGGSAAGITAAQSGTADIGMSSRALKEEEKSLWYVEIARDGLAIVVNPANPVKDLTLDQVRSIYSETITNWREVGGADHEIHVITREEGSGTRAASSNITLLSSGLLLNIS
jgi:phosphate transport system substrate-binding protein